MEQTSTERCTAQVHCPAPEAQGCVHRPCPKTQCRLRKPSYTVIMHHAYSCSSPLLLGLHEARPAAGTGTAAPRTQTQESISKWETEEKAARGWQYPQVREH